MASEVPPVELFREVAFPRRTIYERIVGGEPILVLPDIDLPDDLGDSTPLVYHDNPKLTAEIMSACRQSVVIDASPVGDYIEKNGVPWPIPPCPPIFPDMFLEYPGRDLAILVQSYEGTMREGVKGVASGVYVADGEDVWDIDITILTTTPKGYIFAPDRNNCVLRSDGTFVQGRFASADKGLNRPLVLRQRMAQCLSEFMLAMAFASCRNVRLVDRPDTRTRQQRREDERKGRDLVTFKVLEIGGITDVYDGPAAKNANPSKRSLHICRGHFSEYTEDKPLFGKYSGRFWIPAHTRGTMDKGRVIKDYRILPPVEATA